MSNNETNTTQTSSAYKFASGFGNSHRIATRFESCIAGKSFEDINMVYPTIASKLMFLSQDIGLDRANLTRSQIVMAYNKQNKAWQGIVKYINMSPDNAYYIIEKTDFENMKCSDARLLLLSKFASNAR